MAAKTPLKLYWSRSKPNFGDWLSPAICAAISGRSIEYVEPNGCDLVAIGSILHRVKHGWWTRAVHVWGSGFIEEVAPRRGKHFYHAVRGRKTAALLQGAEVQALGDPGLLCDLLVPDYKSIPKQHALGIIPHYQDKGYPAVVSGAAQRPGAKVLDVFTELPGLLREIAACEMILSSSLHGLIVADAFGIPNAWIKVSGELRGGDFKFHDYYSAFGINNPQPLGLNEGLTASALAELAQRYERPGLAELKLSLLASFPFPPGRIG